MKTKDNHLFLGVQKLCKKGEKILTHSKANSEWCCWFSCFIDYVLGSQQN